MSTQRAAATALAAVLLVIGLLNLGLLGSCATQKGRLPAVVPQLPAAAPAESPPSARLETGTAISLDQYRLKLPFVLLVENSGRTRVSLESLDCRLFVEGTETGGLRLHVGKTLEGGTSLSLPLELPLDTRDLGSDISGAGGPAAPGWRLEARLHLAREDGSGIELPLSAQGSFPLVREPSFRITSIRVERDLLVTTQLSLGLEIHNPNAFPLELRSFDYDFYGEGRIWANGGSAEAATIPAGGSLERGLRFTMNFADMDRRLFDLVAKLRVVRYRIAGVATIATGLEYLPGFVASFDDEGSCAVER